MITINTIFLLNVINMSFNNLININYDDNLYLSISIYLYKMCNFLSQLWYHYIASASHLLREGEWEYDNNKCNFLLNVFNMSFNNLININYDNNNNIFIIFEYS